MEFANLYQPIYLIIVTLCTFVVAMQYDKSTLKPVSSGHYSNYGGALFLCIFLTLGIGLRPWSGVFCDTMNYVGYYQATLNHPFYFTFDTENVIFDNMLLFFSSKNISLYLFFTIIAAIYFGGAFIACKKLFPENVLITFLIFLGAFSTFSYGTNGIKAGVGASAFLLALAYRDNKIISIILMIVSYGLHHSMNAAIVAFWGAYFYKNTKMIFLYWAVCVAIAALHIQYFQFLFGSLADESGASYLLATENDENHYITGFRPDFLLYSAVPVFIGYWMIYKKNVKNSEYEFLLRVYMLANSVWLLCMYASFANRIAYMSWSILPIMVVYPFLNIRWEGNRARYTKRIALYHLAFTLFMFIIYYNI